MKPELNACSTAAHKAKDAGDGPAVVQVLLASKDPFEILDWRQGTQRRTWKNLNGL
jgi:hypothetical protein